MAQHGNLSPVAVWDRLVISSSAVGVQGRYWHHCLPAAPNCYLSYPCLLIPLARYHVGPNPEIKGVPGSSYSLCYWSYCITSLLGIGLHKLENHFHGNEGLADGWRYVVGRGRSHTLLLLYLRYAPPSLLDCGYMWNKIIKNNFEIISLFYFACNHGWNWNKITAAAERVLKLFQNVFQRYWTCWKIFVGCNDPLK